VLTRMSTERSLPLPEDRPRPDNGDDINRKIGARLRRRRRLLGLTQTDVAVRCGVRFQQVQKYETGQSRVSAVQLMRLAAALSVPVAYFFDGLEAGQSQVSRPVRELPGVLP
jgi:transcriptional regulator with XRE-family HTH domain